MYIKLETSRLDYLRSKQHEIRAELYQGIVDSVNVGETQGNKVGWRIVLPASFIDGPRDMRKRYMDAMALVQRFGKPDIFLTITCNPNWPEIKAELESNQEIQNIPDLIVRLFRAKLEELKRELFRKQIFGPVAAFVYVVEFQKRGLPHAHFLITLKPESKLTASESFDDVVCAEIPSQTENESLYLTVTRHTMHGPCGHLNLNSVCMQKNGTCRNKYPKSFCSETTKSKNSYPKYRRRNDGIKIRIRGADLDNRWVVPYNPYLLAKFNCHMNVEIRSTMKAVKYLYKYIYKGHDRIMLNFSNEGSPETIDEITNFQSARWVSPSQALMWRIYSFPLNEIEPSVITLQLHLENKQPVTLKKSDNLENIVRNDFRMKSMLTEYFFMNKIDDKAQTLLYKEFPENFVWNQRDKIWTTRKQGNVIGRVVIVNPIDNERYYLLLLLNHIKGATSFDHLKKVNNIQASSFREAAFLHGLLDTDDNIELALKEASSYQMPQALRHLFATILMFCKPDNPQRLWKIFEIPMSDDYALQHNQPNKIRSKVLEQINHILESMGKTIYDYNLVDQIVHLDQEQNSLKEIHEELQIVVDEKDIVVLHNVSTMNKDMHMILY